jgi:Protein of unknown function (DUF2723)
MTAQGLANPASRAPDRTRPGRPAPERPAGGRLPDLAAPWLLGAAALAARLTTAAGQPTEWDSVQLVLGVDSFDVRVETPHAPGYWLYVAAGRLVRALGPLDAHGSLLLLSALASAATVGLGYAVGRALAGRWLGLAAAAYLLCLPVLWYHGSIVSTYPFDALVGLALVWLAVRARPSVRSPVATCLVLGLGCGIRPSMALVFAPIAAVALARGIRGLPALAAAAAAGVAAVASWMVPMLAEQPGGYGAWRAATRRIFEGAAGTTSLLYGGPDAAANLERAVRYTLAAVGPLAVVAVVALVAGWVRARGSGRPGPDASPGTDRLVPGAGSAAMVLLVAAVPPLVVLALLHFPKAGYALAYLPALVLLLLLPAARLPRRGRALAGIVVAVLCLLNAGRFLAGSSGPTWEGIRRVDQVAAALASLPAVTDPRRDVLVFVEPYGAERYRLAMYRLPGYRAVIARNGQVVRAAVGGREHPVPGVREVPVAPGGRAVLVVDPATAELAALQAAGTARRLELTGGRTVWAVGPGTEIYGLRVVERPEEQP